jgi:hypothetical protein
LSDTKQSSYKAFEIENKPLETISLEKGVAVSTVVGHLEDAVLIGLPLNFTRLGVTPEKIDQVEKVLRNPPINSSIGKLTIIKEQLPQMSWEDLKMCLALIKRKFGVGIIYSNVSFF